MVEATEYGEQDGGFVATYILPTGPIHRAIHLLQQQYQITVRPGFDGRKAMASAGCKCQECRDRWTAYRRLHTSDWPHNKVGRPSPNYWDDWLGLIHGAAEVKLAE